MSQTPIYERVIKSRGGVLLGATDRDEDITQPDAASKRALHAAAYAKQEGRAMPLKRRVDDEGIYRPMATEEGFSTMGFIVVRDDGRVDRFSYASMGDMELYEGEHAEYLSFVHRTKAVTLTGVNLFPIMEAENSHTLGALYQYGNGEDGKPLPYRKSLPLITDVLITDVERRNDTTSNAL